MFSRPRWPALLAGLVAMATVSVASVSASAAPSGFVTTSGGHFVLDGSTYRYGGTNNYYLGYQSNVDVDNALAAAQAANLTVERTWGFIDIGSTDGSMKTIDGSKNGVYYQYWDPSTGAPAYNDGSTGLEHLDYALADAKAHGLKVIVDLTNNWSQFGGIDQYNTWYNLPYHDSFYTDSSAQTAFKNWISHLLNRVNTVSGVAYKDDPTIFSWELANEPRCVGTGNLPTSGTCTSSTLTTWANTMSTYIKGIDANHMVSVGDEGFYTANSGSGWPYADTTDGVDNPALTNLPNIDFGTYHLYPDSWGQSASWGTQWISDHIASAAAAGKPTIAEEFGLQDKSTRDSVYETWTQTVRTGGGAGWNVWMLAANVNGSPYPDYDGFTVYYPSSTASVLSTEALAIGGSSSGSTSTAP